MRLHWPEVGQDAVDAKIGVEPSGEAFNEISVDDIDQDAEEPDDQCRRNRRSLTGPRSHTRRTVRPCP